MDIDDEIRMLKKKGIREMKWSPERFDYLFEFVKENGFMLGHPAYYMNEKSIKLLKTRYKRGLITILRYMGVNHSVI